MFNIPLNLDIVLHIMNMLDFADRLYFIQAISKNKRAFEDVRFIHMARFSKFTKFMHCY